MFYKEWAWLFSIFVSNSSPISHLRPYLTPDGSTAGKSSVRCNFGAGINFLAALGAICNPGAMRRCIENLVSFPSCSVLMRFHFLGIWQSVATIINTSNQGICRSLHNKLPSKHIPPALVRRWCLGNTEDQRDSDKGKRPTEPRYLDSYSILYFRESVKE